VRDYEIARLTEAGIDVPVASGRYSINENLLGTTISGGAIDRFGAPENDTWQLCRRRADWPAAPLEIVIGFERGEAVRLDGKQRKGPELLRELNQRLGAYGVGRHIYTGDVSIGLKGRIVFECPGITGLLAAHQALEDAVNTRLQNQFRHVIAARWAELVYTGFFYEPHKVDLQAMLKSSQAHINGSVTLWTEGGTVLAIAIDSPHILADKDAVYAQSCTWSPEEAVGFIKLLGQSSTLSARINGSTVEPR
jgi:argininosuccinate synthase